MQQLISDFLQVTTEQSLSRRHHQKTLCKLEVIAEVSLLQPVVVLHIIMVNIVKNVCSAA